MAREDTYQHLKIFDDVVGLISSNYVEKVDVDKVMQGRYEVSLTGWIPTALTCRAAEVKQVVNNQPSRCLRATWGLELHALHATSVIAARDNSPAAKAGLRTGDYIRAINDRRRATCRSGKACARCAARPARR